MAVEEAEGGGTDSSSPDSSMMSSFRMEFGMYRNRRNDNKRDHGHVEMERDSNSRGASDEEDDNGLLARKKLRLTKDQSAFLEESFKEHHTLNPVSRYIYFYCTHPWLYFNNGYQQACMYSILITNE